jgi:hypothetical protein
LGQKRSRTIRSKEVILLLRLIKNMDHRTGCIYSEKAQFIEDTMTEEGYRVPPRKSGFKSFDEIPLPKEMTYPEKGRMVDLAKCMISTTNMLGYRKNGKIFAYTAEGIIDKVQLSPKRGRQFLQKMIRLGVMQKVIRKYGDVESEEYYINPAYFFAGKRISFNLYLLFREHLDPILPGWVKNDFLMAAREIDDPEIAESKKKFIEHVRGAGNGQQ